MKNLLASARGPLLLLKVPAGLQISLKIKLRSEAKAKRKRNFFREKLRSEAKRKYFSFVRSEAKRTIFENCEKLRKIAKLRKKFLSFKKSLSTFDYFNYLYKRYIYDVKSLYRLFGHLS